MARIARITLRAIGTVVAWALLLPACNRQPNSAPPTTSPSGAKVASLVPAATDIILGMGAADHLVAVSNYDTATLNGAELPHVGDYQSTDWETLANLHPGVLIIQMDEQRLPPAFRDKAARLNIRLVNVRPVQLTDAIQAIHQIGDAIGEPAKAKTLADRIESQLAAVKQRAKTRRRVRTLMTLDEEGKSLVGPGTYLDDLLTAAGGENVAAPLNASWPAADRETLLRLKPDVVLIFRPGARQDFLDKAKKNWSSLPQVPAARDGHIYLMNEPYALLPGAHVGDVADWIEQRLTNQTGATAK